MLCTIGYLLVLLLLFFDVTDAGSSSTAMSTASSMSSSASKSFSSSLNSIPSTSSTASTGSAVSLSASTTTYSVTASSSTSSAQSTTSQASAFIPIPPGTSGFSAPLPNPWAGLTDPETSGATSFLHKWLTSNVNNNQSNTQDIQVVRTTFLHPNKTDVVAFLDRNGTYPKRYARATVLFGGADAYFQEYSVGPLPVSDATHVEPLTYPFNNQDPGRTPASGIDPGLNMATLPEIVNITKMVWNTTIPGDLIATQALPVSRENNRDLLWFSLWQNFTSVYPLGLSFVLDVTNQEAKVENIRGWYFRGNFYNSTAEFMEAVTSPSFIKPLSPSFNTDYQPDLKDIPSDNHPPPVAVVQGDARFKIDTKDSFVSWMGFTFFFGVSDDIGLGLFDIRYNNSRLMYELSFQQAITSYASSDPFYAHQTLLDDNYGSNNLPVPLVRGYDCPDYASYLPVTVSQGNSTQTIKDAMCLFEFNTGFPARHYEWSGFQNVARNIIMTARTFSRMHGPVYLIEYNFFFDGAIEVSARASGSIQVAYWEEESEYGSQIHDHVTGPIYDQILTFKADLDILGDSNSAQKLQFVPTTAVYPWSNGQARETFKVNQTFLSEESSILWDSNDASIYTIVNRDKPNAFGDYPGYRMKSTARTAHLTNPRSTSIQNAADNAQHDFYVTRQKDTEPRAADSMNYRQINEPLVRFSKFLDNESVEQEDIVVWFNLGMHHMPSTGDYPHIMCTSTHSAMRFEPMNYLLGNPSLSSKQQINIWYNANGTVSSVFEFFQIKGNATCPIPK